MKIRLGMGLLAAALALGGLAVYFWPHVTPPLPPQVGATSRPPAEPPGAPADVLPAAPDQVNRAGVAAAGPVTSGQTQASPIAASATSDLLARIPEGVFRTQLLRLAPAARAKALARLARFPVPKEDFGSLHVAATGDLYYTCDFPPPLSAGPAGIPAISGPRLAAAAGLGPQAAAVPISSPPVRHSKPGAPNVLYLDFNGHTITGTNWNSSYSVATYVAKPFNTDADAATFSDAEQAVIIEVWSRVAEDYASFDVDVTTEEPATFNNQTGRAVITSKTDANGVSLPSSGSGGVAYLGVFGESGYATFSPALIYFDNLGSNAAFIAEATAHELGHNMGLSHDGKTDGTEYYGGHGSAEISWGPIMGTGYNRNVSQWSKGEYYLANNPEDDFAIISAALGYRPDEAGGTTATPAAAAGTTASVSLAGVIANVADTEVYAFNAGAGTISLNVASFVAASGTRGGNTDLKLELLDASGAVVASADPADHTYAALTYGAPAGKFFVRLTAAGTGDPMASTPAGYTSYGGAGQYTLTGTFTAAAPVIVSTASVSAPAGQLFTYAILGTNAPTTYAATGLPAGLSVDASTGLITGRPTATGVFNVTLGATNGLGTANTSLTLTVTDAAPVVTAQTTGRQSVAAGGTLTLSVTALSANGAPTYQWRRNGQPVGGATASTLALSNATPAMAGWYQVYITNSIGTTRSAAMFVQVVPYSTAVTGWGFNTSGQATPPGGLVDAIALAGGGRHALALKSDGTVVAWGDNSTGQATVPAGLTDVVAIAAAAQITGSSPSYAFAYDYSLALKADGTVVGWGDDSFGPTDIPSGLSGVVAIAAGTYHALALKSDGTVVAWGNNGQNQSTVPGGLTEVVAIGAGSQNSLAVKSDGTVVVWGSNFNGESNVPVGLANVVQVVSGGFQSLALKTDGTVTNWGVNSYGAAPGGFVGVSLAAGYRFSAGLKSDGTVAVWPASATDGVATVPGGLAKVFGLSAGRAFMLAVRDTSPLTQTISFGSLSDMPYTVTPVILSATATSGLPVSFSLMGGPATLSGNSLTLQGTGVVTVRASQAGNGSYASAPNVDRSFTVTGNFASWQVAKFSSGELADSNLSGPNAVYGLDGLPNLVKYALGFEPKTNITSGLPVVTTTASDWVYTYTRPASVTDLTYSVEISTNLTTWTSAGVTHAFVSSGAGGDTWCGRYPLASAANLYFRLKVVR